MPSRFLNNIKINDEYSFPNADGSADQIIKTDGAGQLSFVDQSTISAGNAEHVVIYAKNTSGSQINKGTPVYITGTVGATDTVAIAPADAGNASHMPAVGLLDDTLLNNEFGYVITGGFMDNITTDPIDGAQPASNDTVYVKAGGGLTLTKPTGSNLIQNVAKVGKVSGGNSGSLIVSSILRTNDVPNLTTGKIWVGTANNTAESTVVHLDETNGRMGIGTTSPSSKLQVNGDLTVGDNSTVGSFINVIAAGSSQDAGIRFGSESNTDSKAAIYTNTSNSDLHFDVTETTRMLIDSGTGNVGIGTTSPSQKLEVVGTISSGAGAGASNLGMDFGGLLTPSAMPSQVRGVIGALNSGTGVAAGSIGYQPRTGVSAAHIFFTEQSEKMRITSSGNVGIGTTSPTQKLDVRDGELVFTQSSVNQNPSGRIRFNEYGNSTVSGSYMEYNGASNYFSMFTNSETVNYEFLRAVRGSHLLLQPSSGNVGIGTTSTSYKLDVSGDGRFGGTTTAANTALTVRARSGDLGDLRFRFDAAGTLQRSYISDYYTGEASNIGFERNNSTGVGVITFDTSNGSFSPSERMRITSAGNVGIGTTNPTQRLEVNGDARFTGKIYTNAGELDSVGIVGKAIANGWAARYDSNNANYSGFFFDANNDASMVLRDDAGNMNVYLRSDSNSYLNGGNLGIGTNSPSEKLHVYNGKAYVTPIPYAANQSAYALKIGAYNSTSFDMGLQAKSSSGGSPYMSFRTTSADDVLVMRGGNVGIGTASPGYKLDVNGSIASSVSSGFPELRLSDAVSDFLITTNSGGDGIIKTEGTSKNIRFFNNSGETMRISGGGNVGIGTTSPTSRLHVKQTLASPSVPMVYFEADRGPSAYGAVNVRVDNLDYGTGMRFVKSGIYDSNAVSFYNGSSPVGNININTSSTSYNTTSDYRLKENLTKITDGIDRLKQLKPKRFNFIGETSIVDGFIAHEAKEVVPESVTGEKDEVLPNGDPVYQGIDQAKIVPLLTAALQEAITKIEELEARIQTLEKK
jgi:hypothetical protein